MSGQQELIELRVDEYTSPCSITATAETKMADIIDMMLENGIRHVPILESKRPVGIISDRDIKLISNFSEARDILAKHIMTPNPYTVVTGSCLEPVVFDMSEKKIGSALVVDTEGSIIGIFTSQDAMNALVEVLRGECFA